MTHENDDDKVEMGYIKILLDADLGGMIPRFFSNNLHLWQGVDDYVKDAIAMGEDEEYWQAWEKVLDNAFFVDEQGKTWTLYQDGDLFAICFDENGPDNLSEFFGY
jgi:hypothetical protein